MIRRLRFAVAALLLASTAAAQQTDEQGARQLLDAFQVYLGQPAATEQGAVSVQPAGVGYRVVIDLERLAEPLAQFGFKLIASDLRFNTARQPDGTWRVNEVPSSAFFEIRGPDQALVYRFSGVTYEGLFDPSLRTFTALNQTIEAIASESTGPDSKSSSRQAEQRTEMTASAVTDGVADLRLRQTVAEITSEVEITTPWETEGTVPSTFKYSSRIESAELDARLNAFRSRAAAELWGFLVAHPSLERIAADQSRFKSILFELLPLFENLEESGAAHGISVDTSFGRFAVDQIGGALRLNGISADGSLATDFRIAGVSIPPGLLPSWATGLVPTDLDMGFRLTGYDLDAPARQLIRDLDLSKEVPIGPKIAESALAVALPRGSLGLTLAPTRIATPLMDVELTGEMTLSGLSSSGRASVRATGLAEAVNALQTAGAGDQQAAQILAALIMAQTLGAPGPDKSTIWEIEARNDGSILVNGRSVHAAR